ncbi:MAG: LamG domain-containing protein [Patescibacteria group bacterium]
MRKIFLTCIFAVILSLSASVSIVEAGFFSSTFPSLTRGLVGHWTFDGKDITNGRLNDISGNGNHGYFSSIATSTFYQPGKIGQAGNFDGVDDYVIIPESGSSLELTTSMTLSVWVYLSVLPGDYKGIIEGQADGNRYLLYTTNSNKVAVFINTPDGIFHTDDASHAPLSLGWNYITATYDGASLKIYTGGVSQYSVLATGSIRTDGFETRIGRYSNRHLKGFIDDVRIYNRDLSAREIKMLYNQGASTKQSTSISPQTAGPVGLSTGLVGHWTFDGKDMLNGVMLDKSGNGNTGRFQNISTSTFFKAGKIGQAGSFDATDDYVNLGTNFSSVLEITQCAWIKLNSAGSYPIILSSKAGADTTEIRFGGGDRLPHFLYNNQFIGGSTPVELGVWNHICGTTDTATKRLYVNGVQVAQAGLGGSNASHGQSYIGFRESHGVYFPGLIDDARIYNRALSAVEIKQLYNQSSATKQGSTILPQTSGATGIDAGLVGRWTFDGKDMTNGRLNDVSGNGNYGNFSNISTSTFFQAGKMGQGVNFDGVDDTIAVKQFTGFADPSTEASVTFWAKPIFSGVNNNFLDFSSGPGNRFLIHFPYSGDVYWDFGDFNGGGRLSTSFNSSWYGVWAQYSFTAKNGVAMKIYRNGVEIASASNPTNSFARGVTLPIIGSQYKGYIDDIRIYNRALSAAEVLQLYSQGK